MYGRTYLAARRQASVADVVIATQITAEVPP
jgi:hypothetical protein